MNSVPRKFCDLKNEILSKISLSELVQKDIKLTRKGNSFLGLCPFHHEKTPSFTINDENGYYYCFGCGEKGDIFSYVMRQKGLSFKDCLLELASFLGISIESQYNERSSNQLRLFSLLHDICSVFEHYLKRNGEALAYLRKRGIEQSTIETFRLGYAPKEDVLLKYIRQKQYTRHELEQSGMLSKSGSFLFRDRIMFPIFDHRFRIVGFGGRTLSADPKVPKYLNSSQSDFFRKGELVYANPTTLNRSLKESVVVVEGYMDVLSLYQQGIHHVVSPLGTSLTEQQLEFLFQRFKKITILFDGDLAGQKASCRAMDRALPLLKDRRLIYFANTNDNEDPASLIQKKGVGAVHELLVKANHLTDFLWMRAQKEHPHMFFPEEKKAFSAYLKEKVQLITDADLRFYYHQEFFEREKKLWDQLLFKGAAVVPKLEMRFASDHDWYWHRRFR